MSNTKRKLSFLGFGTGNAEGGGGEELVQLDDEIEKVFQRPVELDVKRLTAATQPNRDPDQGRGGGRYASDEKLEDGGEHDRSESETQMSLPETPYESPRHVQFNSGSGGGGGGAPEGAEVDCDATTTSTNPAADDDDERKQERKARHHHHHKSRKYSLQETHGHPRRISVQPEDEDLAEADIQQLDSHRSDDPRAMRRPKIQPKAMSGGNIVSVSRKEIGDKLQNTLATGTYRKMYDHSPHSVFVQLDELFTTGDEQEWKETARWIKYEEDVEEGSDRWGKPHVAPLSFHSLLNLRRCLETGVVLMDLDEKDLPGVAYRVVDRMVSDGLIEEDDKPVVMRSLLLRHRHVNEHDRGFRFSISGRKHSSYTSLQSLWVEEGGRQVRCSVCSATAACRRHSSAQVFVTTNLAEQQRNRRASATPLENISNNNSTTDIKSKLRRTSEHKIDMNEETYTASQEELRKNQNDSILKRIPEDAEATTVLVGAVGFLDQPTIAFVRLAEGILMPSITEVPIPVRFMFILLGPSTSELDYHEVGRSISTLMSNPEFHKIAYKADDRRDLLSAINEFLDDSIVLPPGNWSRQALLPFDELKSKADMIRRRKTNALEKKQAAAVAAGIVPQITTMDETKKALLAAEGIPPPPQNPLDKTGRPFGGMVRDMKRRYPLYPSDFKDALNGQCLAATIFMYFASLSGAIAFGGMMSEKTDGHIGISETLVFTCVGGIIFALLGGQPMMNIGTTGPLLLFDASLYSFCTSFGFDYLVARMCMGVWIFVIALAVAAAEGSVLVKKFTRFTEDIFASLISTIFIAEAVTKMIVVFQMHPLLTREEYFINNPSPIVKNVSIEGNGTSTAAPPTQHVVEPNTALFCTFLTLGTFTIAYYLRIFRNGKFLGRSVRRALGDFGVPIAIVIMVTVGNVVSQVYTDKLNVPKGLTPTIPDRPWLIFMYEGIHNFAFWKFFVMVVPASMVYIITFMETHIAELIIDKPERNLKKGSGFHMDIVMVSLVNMVCGIFGGPWQCVATVRSVSHVSALTVMSTTHAPGDKPYVIEVKEQRLTGLLVATLVGVSVLMSSFLRMVPVSVLFGVFLYMGISSINGIQLFERSVLLFKPVKHHPQVPYVRRVPTMKMHLFTVIQILCLVMLFVIKSSPISLFFPFFLILMIPLRWVLERVFSPLELRAMDGKQPELDMDDEPDFYEQANMAG